MKQKRKNGGTANQKKRRANNTGTLERRGDRWLARWYVYTPQGERKRQSKLLDATSHEEARRELAALTDGNALITREKILERNQRELDGVRAELQQVEDARPALALVDMFEAYRASLNRPQSGERTLDGYEAQAANFVQWVEEHYPAATEMRHISAEIATAFLNHLGANQSANTYNKYTNLLRLIWRTIGNTQQARCTVNPWEGIRRKPQPKTNGRRALTLEELAAVTKDLTGEMRTLFALGIFTGLRLGDCALMEWGAIDLARGVIVTTPRKTAKTGRAVEIPIYPALGAILAETPQRLRRGYLMPELAATYLRNTSLIARYIKRVFEKAGIQTSKAIAGYSQQVAEVGFHSLRHSFVSLMGNAGAPLALVQSIVGHYNPMMTAHYFHAQTDALANAVAKLPNPFANCETIDAELTDPLQIAVDPSKIAQERAERSKGKDIPPSEEARLGAFYALFEAMTPDERRQAVEWINANA